MKFDPDIYTITIRKEDVDGDIYYVGRVAEFLNVTAYENTYEDALAVIRSALREIASRATETGKALPRPMSECSTDPSGRMTLRMPRSLHARLNAQAQIDEMSANQLINLAVAEYLTGTAVVQMAADKITKVIDENMTGLRRLHGTINLTLLNPTTSASFQQQNTYSQDANWQTNKGIYIAPQQTERFQ